MSDQKVPKCDRLITFKREQLRQLCWSGEWQTSVANRQTRGQVELVYYLKIITSCLMRDQRRFKKTAGLWGNPARTRRTPGRPKRAWVTIVGRSDCLASSARAWRPRSFVAPSQRFSSCSSYSADSLAVIVQFFFVRCVLHLTKCIYFVSCSVT